MGDVAASHRSRPLVRRLVLLLVLLLTLGGLWQLGSSAWTGSKARLAQYLLEQSWATMRESLPQRHGAAVKPWPWADTYPAARLRVPRLNIEQIVLQGDSGRTLAFGPGLSSDSAAPGAAGGTVISGHRDTHFAFLHQLRSGMEVQLETLDRRWVYRVRETQVVDIRRGGILLPEDRQGLLLVTCFPFDALEAGGPLRYLVWAEPETSRSPSVAL